MRVSRAFPWQSTQSVCGFQARGCDPHAQHPVLSPIIRHPGSHGGHPRLHLSAPASLRQPETNHAPWCTSCSCQGACKGTVRKVGILSCWKCLRCKAASESWPRASWLQEGCRVFNQRGACCRIFLALWNIKSSYFWICNCAQLHFLSPKHVSIINCNHENKMHLFHIWNGGHRCSVINCIHENKMLIFFHI